MTWKNDIINDLKRDEGVVLHAYQDHLGYLTIGCGRLIDKRKNGGITRQEADLLLQNDVSDAIADLEFSFPWFTHLSDLRKRALVNMRFQLGMGGLLGFQKMLKALAEEKWDEAADEALDSKWAQQTPHRAERIAMMIRSG